MSDLPLHPTDSSPAIEAEPPFELPLYAQPQVRERRSAPARRALPLARDGGHGRVVAERGHPDHPARARLAKRHDAPMDRRRVRVGVRRAPAHGRRTGRSFRSQEGAAVRPGRVRRGRVGQRPGRFGVSDHRRPGIQGIGAAARDAGDVVVDHGDLPAGRASTAIAIWVGFAGAGAAIGPSCRAEPLLERFSSSSASSSTSPSSSSRPSPSPCTARDPDEAATPSTRAGALSAHRSRRSALAIIEGPERDGPTPSSSRPSWPCPPSSPSSCSRGASPNIRCCR